MLRIRKDKNNENNQSTATSSHGPSDAKGTRRRQDSQDSMASESGLPISKQLENLISEAKQLESDLSKLQEQIKTYKTKYSNDNRNKNLKELEDGCKEARYDLLRKIRNYSTNHDVICGRAADFKTLEATEMALLTRLGGIAQTNAQLIQSVKDEESAIEKIAGDLQTLYDNFDNGDVLLPQSREGLSISAPAPQDLSESEEKLVTLIKDVCQFQENELKPLEKEIKNYLPRNDIPPVEIEALRAEIEKGKGIISKIENLYEKFDELSLRLASYKSEILPYFGTSVKMPPTLMTSLKTLEKMLGDLVDDNIEANPVKRIINKIRSDEVRVTARYNKLKEHRNNLVAQLAAENEQKQRQIEEESRRRQQEETLRRQNSLFSPPPRPSSSRKILLATQMPTGTPILLDQKRDGVAVSTTSPLDRSLEQELSGVVEDGERYPAVSPENRTSTLSSSSQEGDQQSLTLLQKKDIGKTTTESSLTPIPRDTGKSTATTASAAASKPAVDRTVAAAASTSMLRQDNSGLLDTSASASPPGISHSSKPVSSNSPIFLLSPVPSTVATVSSSSESGSGPAAASLVSPSSAAAASPVPPTTATISSESGSGPAAAPLASHSFAAATSPVPSTVATISSASGPGPGAASLASHSFAAATSGSSFLESSSQVFYSPASVSETPQTRVLSSAASDAAPKTGAPADENHEGLLRSVSMGANAKDAEINLRSPEARKAVQKHYNTQWEKGDDTNPDKVNLENDKVIKIWDKSISTIVVGNAAPCQEITHILKMAMKANTMVGKSLDNVCVYLWGKEDVIKNQVASQLSDLRVGVYYIGPTEDSKQMELLYSPIPQSSLCVVSM